MPGSRMTKEVSQVSHLYILPLLIYLFARTYSLTLGAISDSITLDSPEKTMLLAVSYLLAAILLVVRLPQATKIGRRLWPLYLYAVNAALTMLWSQFPDVVALRVGHLLGLALIAICAALWGREQKYGIHSVTLLFACVSLLLSIVIVKLIPIRGIIGTTEMIGEPTGRWVGVTSHPNFLGALSFVALWSAFFVGWVSKSTIWRLVAGLTILMASLTLLRSDSRTAEVAVAVILCTHFVIRGENLSVPKLFKRIVLICFIAIMFGLIGGILLSSDMGLSFLPTVREGATDSLSGRPQIWASGIEAFIEMPFGWSFDLLKTYWASHGNAFLFPHFHNGFLDVAVKGGVIGEILLWIIIVSVWRTLLKLNSLDPKLAKTYLSFFCAMVVYNLTETGFDREELMWSIWVVMWTCAVSRVEFLLYKQQPLDPSNKNFPFFANSGAR